MATTKNLATVPSVDLSNQANLLAEVNGEIVRLPYSLIDEKLVPLEEHMDNENNPHKLDVDDIGAATAQEVQDLKTEFSEYKISNDAELAKQKSDLNEIKTEVDNLPTNEELINNATLIGNVSEVVIAEIPLVKTAEQPTFVNSIDEMTDTSKVYVMPDGYLYAYMEGKSSRTFTTEDFVEVQLNTDGSIIGTATTTPNRIATTELIDLSDGTVSIHCPSPYQYIIYYYTSNSTDSYIGKTSFKTGNISDALKDTITSGKVDGATHCRISLRDSTNTSANLSGRTDEFVANVIISQAGNGSAYFFQSTGLSYNQPTDYEARIVALENALGGIENGTY